MARGNHTDDVGYFEVAVSLDFPFTLAGWVRRSDVSVATFTTLINKANASARGFYIRHNTSGGGDFVTLNVGGSPGSVTVTPTGTASSLGWNHVGAVVTATNARSVWLNGQGKVSDTTSISTDPTTMTFLQPGSFVYNGGATISYGDGWVAETGLWDVALSDGEMEALGKGFPCHLIRPDNLLVHLPMVRGATDLINGVEATTTGNAVGTYDHPPVMAAIPV